MGSERFDALSRAIGTRRSVVTTLLAGALAWLRFARPREAVAHNRVPA